MSTSLIGRFPPKASDRCSAGADSRQSSFRRGDGIGIGIAVMRRLVDAAVRKLRRAAADAPGWKCRRRKNPPNSTAGGRAKRHQETRRAPCHENFAGGGEMSIQGSHELRTPGEECDPSTWLCVREMDLYQCVRRCATLQGRALAPRSRIRPRQDLDLQGEHRGTSAGSVADGNGQRKEVMPSSSRRKWASKDWNPTRRAVASSRFPAKARNALSAPRSLRGRQ